MVAAMVKTLDAERVYNLVVQSVDEMAVRLVAMTGILMGKKRVARLADRMAARLASWKAVSSDTKWV
jgi:hypothetical protein